MDKTPKTSDALYETVLTAHLKEQRQARYWNYGFKGLVLFYVILITWFTLKASNRQPQVSPVTSKPHVALITLEGAVQSKGEGISAHQVIPVLKKAFEAEQVQAIVLSIDSPGGSPVEAWDVVSAIERFKQDHPEKKVHAVIRNVGASAAYLIAAGADTIHASPMSLVGSIGAVMGSVGVTELMDQWGFENRTITSGRYKDLGSPMRAMEQDDRALLQERVDGIAKTFQDKVVALRGDRLSHDPLLFSGLWWTGDQALALGVVDALGSVDSLMHDEYADLVLEEYEAELSVKEMMHQFKKMFRMNFQQSMQQALGLKVSVDEGSVF